jgi:capsular exopolysaccharide synthesis family protein
MTTLPHTAPIRLPRQTSAGQLPGPGNGQMTIAGPGALGPVLVGPGGAAPGAAQMAPADVLRVIRSNLWLIILSLILSVAGGWAVNQYILKPHYSRYTSTALCRVYTDSVVKGKIDPTRDVGGGVDTQQEAATQASMLRHESLLIDVLGDPSNKIRQTRWWNEFGNNVEAAKEDLLDHFAVAPIPDSALIAVSMEYRVPEDCKTIVYEIVQQHLKKEKQRKNDEFVKNTQPLRERVNNLRYDLESCRRRIKEKAQMIGDNASSSATAKQGELSNLFSERIHISRELGEAQNKLTNLTNLNNAGQDPPGLDDKLARDDRYLAIRRKMDDIQLDMTTDVFGPDHPKAQTRRTKLAAYQQQLDDVREEVKNNLFASLNAEYRADIDTFEKLLKEARAQIERVTSEVARSEAERREMDSLQAEEEMLNREWQEANSTLNKMQAFITQTESSNIDWARLPAIPDVPSFPKLSIVLTVAVMAGLALSLGIAFLRELTDNTVRTPKDIARVGQLNLLGVLPHESDDPESAGARLPLVIFDAPHSMLAEQFRQLRSRLQYAASLDTTRSLLVTSAGAGDGKTTVATNLAAGLALNGRRILLVDANFRKPALHEVFGAANEAGFSDVLNSLDQFEHCVLESQVPNLSVLPSGPRPVNPTELLESQLLIDFIDRALEEYDHVIFDTGPLPMVSETIALAPRVDGVVTVIRASKNSRGLLQRVRDTLRQVKAEHVGVVLNAVRAQAGGYYGRNILDYYKYQNGGVNSRH